MCYTIAMACDKSRPPCRKNGEFGKYMGEEHYIRELEASPFLLQHDSHVMGREPCTVGTQVWPRNQVDYTCRLPTADTRMRCLITMSSGELDTKSTAYIGCLTAATCIVWSSFSLTKVDISRFMSTCFDQSWHQPGNFNVLLQNFTLAGCSQLYFFQSCLQPADVRIFMRPVFYSKIANLILFHILTSAGWSHGNSRLQSDPGWWGRLMSETVKKGQC